MMLMLALSCFIGGITFGWFLFRSERVYQQGFRDGERHGRAEGFKTGIQKTSPRYLLNPETGDWNNS